MRGMMMAMAAALLAAPALAQDVIALSPEERAAAIEAAATRDPAGLEDAGRRQVHGEMGVEIGTGGRAAVYGSTLVPLGDTGTLGLSFLDARGPTWRGR